MNVYYGVFRRRDGRLVQLNDRSRTVLVATVPRRLDQFAKQMNIEAGAPNFTVKRFKFNDDLDGWHAVYLHVAAWMHENPTPGRIKLFDAIFAHEEWILSLWSNCATKGCKFKVCKWSPRPELCHPCSVKVVGEERMRRAYLETH